MGTTDARRVARTQIERLLSAIGEHPELLRDALRRVAEGDPINVLAAIQLAVQHSQDG